VFLINLIPLHVLVLMATGRFSHRVYVAYSTVSVCNGCVILKRYHIVTFLKFVYLLAILKFVK